MNTSTRFLCAIAVAWTAFPCAADDLLSLYQESLAKNAGFAAAQSENTAVKELLPQAKSKFLPNVSLNADVTNSLTRNQAATTQNFNYTSTNVGVNLVQPIYKKELDIQYDQVGARIREADAKLEDARQELALKVAKNYFEILLAEDNITLLREQKAAIVAQLEQAKRMFDSGFGTVTDVNEARARLDTVDAQEIDAKNNHEVSLHALHELTNKLPTSLSPLGAVQQKAESDPETLDKWIEMALEQSPLIHLNQARFEASTQEIDKAKANDSPSVDLVAGLSHSKDPSYTALNTRNTTAEIGIKFSMPLYQGGFSNSRISQAKALNERARHELDAVRRQVMQQTRQEYLNVVSGMVMINALEQALRSHEIALDSMQKGFKAGVRTNVEILNQQQLLFTAKRDLLKARYETLISRLQLKKAAGSLDEAEMTRVNAWLAPAAAGTSVALADSIVSIKAKTQLANVVQPAAQPVASTSGTLTTTTPPPVSTGVLPVSEKIEPVELTQQETGKRKTVMADSALKVSANAKNSAAPESRPVGGFTAKVLPSASPRTLPGPVYLQIGAFKESQRALQLTDDIARKLGKKVAEGVSYSQSSGLTKVKMGPYYDAGEVASLQTALQSQLAIKPNVVLAMRAGNVSVPTSALGSASIPTQASTPAAESEADSAVASPTQGIYLQMAALSTKSAAEAFVERARSVLSGLPQIAMLESQARFKVRIGPFNSPDLAKLGANQIEKALGVHPFHVKP